MNRFLLIIFFLVPSVAFADDYLDFSQAVDDMNTLQGNFTQRVLDNKNNIIQDVEGSFLFKKPNLFKWNYDYPFKSQIICDGELLYLYDPDLKQVVISPLQKLGGVSPAMLLVSSSASNYFNIHRLENDSSEQAFEAIPKNLGDTSFKKVFIYFNRGLLSQMHILDNLNHRTEISFKKLKSNTEINEASFLFNMPENVDVIKN